MDNQYEIAAETLGKDLLGILVQELRVMPDVWQKLSQQKQDDVINRVRSTVEQSVVKAVRIIASEGKQKITGELLKINITKKKEAVVQLSPGNNLDDLHALYESVNEPVAIIIAHEGLFTGDMEGLRGEPDQRDFGDETYSEPEAEGETLEHEELPAPEGEIQVEPSDEAVDAEYEEFEEDLTEPAPDIPEDIEADSEEEFY